MIESIQISKLSSLEWEEYKKLRLEALREDGQAFGDSYGESLRLDDDEWKHEFEDSESFLMVARDAGNAVAMAAAYRESGEKMRHVYYVWGVYVKKAYRGKGLGRELMEALLEEIGLADGIEKVNLNVNTSQKTAVRLYEKLGFEISGTLHKELKIGKQYYDEYLMEKFM